MWTLSNAKWRKFAEGLQEPCGLLLDRKDGKETGSTTRLEVAKDGLSLFFKTELAKRHVYDIKLPAVRSADGKTLSVNHGYYTLNETLD